MANLKELSERKAGFVGGHRLCPGCGAGIIARQVLLAAKGPVVVVNATGCLEVASTIFPYSSWQVPWFHNAFENAASSVSGVEAAYRSLKKQGRIKENIRFIAFGGDGGTYDIGLQALSGAVERGHRFLYVCYNNQAYMNTGIQRSSATPKGANTTTAPAGTVIPGKVQFKKELTPIMVAHQIPYAATSTVGKWNDLMGKTERALDTNGPSFIDVLSPCRLGWKYPPELTPEIGRLAADTCFWPLYEVVNGEYHLTYKPKEKKPITEWLKLQGRFKHLFKPENRALVENIQNHIDERWEKLLKLCGQ